jgi:radical SAM superfamily enzyme YgiQ (UPF0313 family)
MNKLSNNSTREKKLIYLADLTHNGLVLSSNVFPLSIGLIGAYILDKNFDLYEIELFKYPEDLSRALETRKPDLVAFANYSWNFHIGYEYSRKIKERWPSLPIVFGGPNYGLTDGETEEFWMRYPLIDFYIVREGEEAFAQLVRALTLNGFNAEALKNSREALANCHYFAEQKIIKGPDLPRLMLEDLPSPYLMGLMDKFFDENLAPLIHTTRGCPFSCAFCTEGSPYYNIVEQRMDSLEEELDYISQRIKGPKDLYVSDANFGMFKQDLEKAKLLAACQKKYNYPKNIHVSTGKNQKERVIDVAKMLDGAISMAASLQSTDPVVLSNVSRSNISVSKLTAVGKLANKVEAGTYSEIILGLPGDSFSAHCQSLRECVGANFDNIRMYQLIMLPQTELNTPENRLKYGMKSKHRIMPRSFGKYELFGDNFVAVESEEILIENSTMDYEQYVKCRELDVTVELLHNGKVYEELQAFCEIKDISWFDFILRFFEKRRNFSSGIANLYDEFVDGLSFGLWESRDQLQRDVEERIDSMLLDERGTNEMSTAKASGFFILFEEINLALFSEMRDWIIELGLFVDGDDRYLEELRKFSLLRKRTLMKEEDAIKTEFNYDMERLAKSHFLLQPNDILLKNPTIFSISHDQSQKESIKFYNREFGKAHDGLGKMLMRYPHIHKLFRSPAMMNHA